MVNGIGLHYPCGMVIDGAGNLYIADVDNGRVVEVPAGGGAAIAIDPLVSGEKLSYPVTLALDSAGRLVHRGSVCQSRGGECRWRTAAQPQRSIPA